MTTVHDLGQWLEGFAPIGLAESWDNVGLLWGDPNASVERVMTCLTVTAQTAREAIDERAQLIVSHHPVLFRPVKRLVAGTADNGYLWDLARAGVSILSPHTAFDNTVGGINDGLATRLGLVDVGPLRPAPPSVSYKLVVFVPEGEVGFVASAAFQAGAGTIGDYDECSFTTSGEGTFLPRQGANPTIGEVGRRESVLEKRLEMVCPAESCDAVLRAIRAAHSYEEPAIDVIPLRPEARGPGSGRLGMLATPCSLIELVEKAAATHYSTSIQFVGDPDRTVQRVAIVCGAGDDFLPDASRRGADVLLTGEARFHRGLEADAMGIGLIVAGHHATERPGVEDLAARVGVAFPALRVWASRVERDPFRAFSADRRATK